MNYDELADEIEALLGVKLTLDQRNKIVDFGYDIWNSGYLSGEEYGYESATRYYE